MNTFLRGSLIVAGLFVFALIWAGMADRGTVASRPSPKPAKVEPQKSLLEQAFEKKRKEDPSFGARGAGYESARKLLSPMLKDPASVEFPWDTVGSTVIEEGKSWRVHGVVRATNDLNAVVSEPWAVVVVLNGETFFPTEASLGGELVWTLESASASKGE